MTYHTGLSPLEMTPEEILGSLNEVEKKNAPDVLYLAGDPHLLTEGSRISVVGTRSVSREGLERTAILASELVSRGITVVSGLAAGVDTMAHRTAIAKGGRTIAVIGTPLDKTYPRENAVTSNRDVEEWLVALRAVVELQLADRVVTRV